MANWATSLQLAMLIAKLQGGHSKSANTKQAKFFPTSPIFISIVSHWADCFTRQLS